MAQPWTQCAPAPGVTVKLTSVVPPAGTVTVFAFAVSLSSVVQEVSLPSGACDSATEQEPPTENVRSLLPLFVSLTVKSFALRSSRSATLGSPSTVANTSVSKASFVWIRPAPIWRTA